MQNNKNLVIPLSAKKIHSTLIKVLQNLIDINTPSPLDHDFRDTYAAFLSLFRQYQLEVIAHNKNWNIFCSVGCSYCCYHWVEDVNSFEAEIISEHIKSQYPHRISELLTIFEQDENRLVELNKIVEKKLCAQRNNREITKIDPIDLLLASFYQLKRPCALLTTDQKCSIYPIRPLTCRIYLSFSKPENCRPEYINSCDIPTYLLDIEEEANKLLDILHSRYNRYNKSGLRSLLIDYLKE